MCKYILLILTCSISNPLFGQLAQRAEPEAPGDGGVDVISREVVSGEICEA
jgi:hypothetical protein